MKQRVEHIIKCENKEYNEFLDYQERKIGELKDLRQKQINGEDVDICEILFSLRESGILDSENNIAEPYSLV